eukprot:TRINITY_DN59992_c0_g1_i1.p1 TRINITY_DN59992_c0_g1~~TRINITY_DN59992_c0_g1_i1.p1  ORF type:complete len:549 (+),score=111.57 TRINITY_DN59992_c0_g1_i1:97-1743(+)
MHWHPAKAGSPQPSALPSPCWARGELRPVMNAPDVMKQADDSEDDSQGLYWGPRATPPPTAGRSMDSSYGAGKGGACGGEEIFRDPQLQAFFRDDFAYLQHEQNHQLTESMGAHERRLAIAAGAPLSMGEDVDAMFSCRGERWQGRSDVPPSMDADLFERFHHLDEIRAGCRSSAAHLGFQAENEPQWIAGAAKAHSAEPLQGRRFSRNWTAMQGWAGNSQKMEQARAIFPEQRSAAQELRQAMPARLHGHSNRHMHGYSAADTVQTDSMDRCYLTLMRRRQELRQLHDIRQEERRLQGEIDQSQRALVEQTLPQPSSTLQQHRGHSAFLQQADVDSFWDPAFAATTTRAPMRSRNSGKSSSTLQWQGTDYNDEADDSASDDERFQGEMLPSGQVQAPGRVIHAAVQNRDCVQTFMVRNIPVQYTLEMLLKEWPYFDSYDLLHLPRKADESGNRLANCNMRFAFVNCVSKEAATEFYNRWNKGRLKHFRSRKPLSLSPADVQGRDVSLLSICRSRPARWQSSDSQPIVFDNNRRVDALALAAVLMRRS